MSVWRWDNVFCGICICTHPHTSPVNAYIHNVNTPPRTYKLSPLISCVLDNLINPFSSTLWASLSFCKGCHFKANLFWSHLLFWHSYVRTSSALSEQGPKMQVKSRSNPDLTWKTPFPCARQPRTQKWVEPCSRPRVESGLKMADKGLSRHDYEAWPLLEIWQPPKYSRSLSLWSSVPFDAQSMPTKH